MSRQAIAAIITCHNLGRTLREALDSVERQTRPATEIVVVDDRSNDLYTRHIIAQLRAEGTHVVEIDAGKPSAARNAGARLTSAPYLVWLDADDILEPTYFESAAGRLDGDASFDFVTCALHAFGATEYTWRPASPTFVDAIATGGVPHASTMIRRQLWESVGGFDESLRFFELLDFWASALERGAAGIVLDEPLLRYRIRPSSGYRRLLRHNTYLAHYRRFYEKHDRAVRANALEFIERKEDFLLSQREYQQLMESRTADAEARLSAIQQQIDAIATRIAAHGQTRVDRGDLGRRDPISPMWGRDRGTPIDRFYIERFLDAHRADVAGRVLEVRDADYTTRFGGSAVTHVDVVDIDPSNSRANIVADLRDASALASETYDCIVITQTLHLIDDIGAAIRECARLLRPGGVILATVPSIIRVDDEAGVDGDYWRLTEASARRLFSEVFPLEKLQVGSDGNVAAATAFLHGLSVQEMSSDDLERHDPTFPIVITIRAVRSGSAMTSSKPAKDLRRSRPKSHAIILAYHRVAELAPDTHALCTPLAVFEDHMKHLAREWTPIGLDTLAEAAADDRIPDRAVVVTLDDGYLDALTAASPILQAFNVPATFFVNSDRLGEPHEKWWDILERLFLTPVALPTELQVHSDVYDVRARTSTPGERAAALEHVNRTMWSLGARDRQSLASHVIAWSGSTRCVRDTHRVLTADELRLLDARKGHTIGAHTTHHLALTTQPLETKQVEVVADKTTLEDVLGHPVAFFSYPYGDLDSELVAVVRDAGFRAAVSVDAGRVTTLTNRLLLPRLEVTPRTLLRFEESLTSMSP